jgi:hypothetical protein
LVILIFISQAPWSTRVFAALKYLAVTEVGRHIFLLVVVLVSFSLSLSLFVKVRHRMSQFAYLCLPKSWSKGLFRCAVRIHSMTQKKNHNLLAIVFPFICSLEPKQHRSANLHGGHQHRATAHRRRLHTGVARFRLIDRSIRFICMTKTNQLLQNPTHERLGAVR